MTCLLQFTYHEPRIDQLVKEYRLLRVAKPQTSDFFTEEHAVQMWSDGAYDHLRELKKPPKIGKTDWYTAQSIAEVMGAWKWATMYGQPPEGMTPTNAHGFVDLARKLIEAAFGSPTHELLFDRNIYIGDPGLRRAMEVDRALGLVHIDTGDAATCESIMPSP